MRNELVGQFTFSNGILENIVQVDGRRLPGAEQSKRTTYPALVHLGGRIVPGATTHARISPGSDRRSHTFIVELPLPFRIATGESFLDCYLRSTRAFTDSPACPAFRGP
jgi:hypothetical protein